MTDPSEKPPLELNKEPLEDLTPSDEEAQNVEGGTTPQKTFAPPYMPVGPVVGGDNISSR